MSDEEQEGESNSGAGDAGASAGAGAVETVDEPAEKTKEKGEDEDEDEDWDTFKMESKKENSLDTKKKESHRVHCPFFPAVSFAEYVFKRVELHIPAHTHTHTHYQPKTGQ